MNSIRCTTVRHERNKHGKSSGQVVIECRGIDNFVPRTMD